MHRLSQAGSSFGTAMKHCFTGCSDATPVYNGWWCSSWWLEIDKKNLNLREGLKVWSFCSSMAGRLNLECNQLLQESFHW